MEFGKLDHIEQIDFSMPPDHAMTNELFAHLQIREEEGLQWQVGCTRWGLKEWLGKVYPKGAKDKDFLAHYVKQFNAIELNSMWYSLQPKGVIEKWASLAGPGFLFCPKFSNTISHQQQLQHADSDTGLFIDHMLSFGPRLGHSFLQLSEGFAPDRAAILQAYARSLPRDFKTCIELRHGAWFRAGARVQGADEAYAGVVQSVWELFRELGIGSVITDTAGRRDCLHMRLTAPVAFIRFVANNLHPTDLTRIDAWADRLKNWIDRGLRQIYFFIHNREESNSPDLCKYAVEQFNKKCGTQLVPPKLLNVAAPGNLSLF